MKYTESAKILQSIKSAKKVLVNCHEHPDADSVGCALAMHVVLAGFGKKSDIVCPEPIPNELKFLPNSHLVKETYFPRIDYSEYDLFLILDTSSWDRVCGSKKIPLPKIKIIQIDHHASNKLYGEINLLDAERKSNSEVLYSLFEDWKVKVQKDVAQCLLAGIIGDTGSFQFNVHPETLEVAAKLMRLGANKEEININLFRSLELGNLRLIGELVRNVRFDQKGKFIWTAAPFGFLKDSQKDLNLDIVDVLLQGVRGADFGIRMVEKSPGDLRASFRARTNFDTSKIAVELGGGGHPAASGAVLSGVEFKDAVEKVLKTARKHSGILRGEQK